MLCPRTLLQFGHPLLPPAHASWLKASSLTVSRASSVSLLQRDQHDSFMPPKTQSDALASFLSQLDLCWSRPQNQKTTLNPAVAMLLQEYLPRIADNDVLKAVEKNTSGSRPKELFEEVLEEVEKQWEADR